MSNNHRRWASQTILDELADREARGLSDAGVTITLKAGDTAWDPASTNRLIQGPARVTYTQHPDGGITAVEREV